MSTTPAGFDLPRCLGEVRLIDADLQKLTADITEAEFQTRPRTGAWSIGDCIEHLVLTGEAFFTKWDSAIQESSHAASSSAQAVRYSWWQRMMLNAFEPPYKIKTKTTKNFIPFSSRPMAETLDRFSAMHGELARRIERSQVLDVARIRVRSPFASWLTYPLGFSFDLALAHERRHMWQAWQVRKQFRR
jgi:hypothetical protein